MKTIAAIVIVIIVVVAAVAYYLTMMPSAPTTTTGQVKIAMILPGRTDDLAWNQAGYNSFTDLSNRLQRRHQHVRMLGAKPHGKGADPSRCP